MNYEIEVYGRYLEEPPVNIALNIVDVCADIFNDLIFLQMIIRIIIIGTDYDSHRQKSD